VHPGAAKWISPPWQPSTNSAGQLMGHGGHPVHGAIRIIYWNSTLYAAIARNQEYHHGQHPAQVPWCFGEYFLNVLLAVEKRFGLPHGLDALYAASDHDPVRSPNSSCDFPPLLVHATSTMRPLGECTVGVPDTTFLSGPPYWCAPESDVPEALLPWREKKNAVLFAGDLWRGDHRPQLRKFAELPATSPERWPVPLIVHNSKSMGPLNWSQQCRYRYLLSLPGAGNGYANRLKWLLRCRSVVLHVGAVSEEFFHSWMHHSVHFVQAESLQALRPFVQQLMANESWAESIANAAREFADTRLSWTRVLHHLHTTLVRHATKHPRREESEPEGYWLQGARRDSHGQLKSPTVDVRTNACGFVPITSLSNASRLIGECDDEQTCHVTTPRIWPPCAERKQAF